MPLAHTAHKPKPRLELVGSTRISAEDALRGIEASLKQVGRESLSEIEVSADPSTAIYEPVNLSTVNFRHIPGLRDALKRDWCEPCSTRKPADCFVEVRGRLEVHLHPCFLGEKLDSGLRAAAGSLLCQYSTVLRCVPLAYTRLRPAGSHGAIVGESPYVHFYADFSVVGFAPRKGQWMPGRLSEQQTRKGINIKILVFNMLVKWKSLPASVTWDDATLPPSWTYLEGGNRKRLDAEASPIWTQVASINLGDTSAFTGILAWPLDHTLLPASYSGKQYIVSPARTASGSVTQPEVGHGERKRESLQERLRSLKAQKATSVEAEDHAKFASIKAEIAVVKRKLGESAVVLSGEASPKKQKKAQQWE